LVALTRCEEFRRVVDRNHLPSLKKLDFLICIPGDLFETFKNCFFNTLDLTWPFNNVSYHLDEQLVVTDCYREVTKTVLLFYTYPLDILLQYTRTVHNHSFAKYTTHIRQRSIEWTCNKADSLNQLGSTLNKLASGNLNTLYLHCNIMQVRIKMI
jgi:hypothetical protein